MGIFYDKVVDRIEKLDAEGLRRHYKALADEIGFFKSVFDSLDEGIVVLDSAGKVEYANAAGKVDKSDVNACRFLYFHSKLKEYTCQGGIVFVVGVV